MRQHEHKACRIEFVPREEEQLDSDACDEIGYEVFARSRGCGGEELAAVVYDTLDDLGITFGTDKSLLSND